MLKPLVHRGSERISRKKKTRILFKYPRFIKLHTPQHALAQEHPEPARPTTNDSYDHHDVGSYHHDRHYPELRACQPLPSSHRFLVLAC